MSNSSFFEIARHNKAQDEYLRLRHAEFLKERVYTAQQMSELATDPRFERWGREVETQKRQAETRAKACEQQLLGSYLTPDQYNKVKCEHATWTGMVQAFDMALVVAKTMIEMGEKAAEELKK